MGKVITFFSCIAALFVLCVPAYSEPTPEQIKERTNLLLQAIENNNVEQAKVCIQLGADVNAKNKGGSTALMIAAGKNAADMAELLIEAGADVNAKDDDDRTALMTVSEKGYKDMVELFIEKGADVNAKDDDGRTALMTASGKGHKDIVELLIEKGADVNTKNKGDRTALMTASGKGYKDIVELLIEKGADVNAKNKGGSTALMIAAEENAAGIAKALIEAGADVSVTDDNGEALFVKMISDRKYYIANLLAKAGADVEAKNSSGDTLLMQNVKNRDKRNVKFLINMGADTNTMGSEGITALTYAALYGRNDIVELLKSGKTDSVTNMVYVEGGTFQMGSTESYDEKPVHTVTISGFYMGKYEVTQAEYGTVMGTNPSKFKGEQRPVENVSWRDAVNYCNMLSEIEGLMPCYTIDKTNVTCDWNANGYRLPTEAEWEYAARGGIHKSAFKYSGSDNIDEVAWYYDNSYALGSSHPDYGTHEVGKKKANALGLYDMSGNVWEWCWDWYDKDYYSNSPANNPHGGPASGDRRVMRGGYWGEWYYSYNRYDGYRCACRGYDYPSNRDDCGGFRVVRSGK